MTADRVGLGFRDHSGWAIVVAAGWRSGPYIRLKAAIETCPSHLPRQPYHAIVELGHPRSRIAEVFEASVEHTAHTLKETVRQLREDGCEIPMAAVPVNPRPLPAELDRVLANHTLLHAAEGALFREVLAVACENSGLSVRRVVLYDALLLAATAVGVPTAELEPRLVACRSTVGPPWTKDHREAAACALVAAEASSPGVR
jgi:hypothetical protein